MVRAGFMDLTKLPYTQAEVLLNSTSAGLVIKAADLEKLHQSNPEIGIEPRTINLLRLTVHLLRNPKAATPSKKHRRRSSEEIKAASVSTSAEEQMGFALRRLNSIYVEAIAAGERAVALSAQRELNALLKNRTSSDVEQGHGQIPEDGRLAAVQAHLESLKLAPPGTDVVELARLVVVRGFK